MVAVVMVCWRMSRYGGSSYGVLAYESLGCQ